MLLTGILASAAKYDPQSHVLPHTLFEVAGYEFTNHHLMSLLSAIVVLLVFAHVAKRVKVTGQSTEDYVTKGRIAQMFETILVYLRDEMTRPMLGHITDRYIKYIWSTFFFILFCNLLGMVPIGPIARLVTGNEHLSHISGTATGNISFTGGLAIVAFFMMHFAGVREMGLPYFKHFNPGPWWMAPIMIPLEIVGALVKPFALAVRLFANMVAGHLVLASLIGLIFTYKNYGVVAASLSGALAFSFLELFVAFLQAYIFTFLTVIFISLGAVHEGDDHEHESSHEPAAEPAV